MSDPFAVDLDTLRRRRTVKWTLYGPDVLAAWVAEMDFAVAPPVRAAIQAAVDREDFGYVEADTSELTTACAGFLGRRHGWSVAPARVFLVADVLVGLGAALDAFVPEGAPVIVPTPAYPPLFAVVRLRGRPVVEVPLVGEHPTLDLDRIESAFREGARAVLLCHPHNPTGRAFTADELAGLAAVVDRHGGRVLADEVHAPLVLPGRTHVPYASVSDASAAHTITVTSASKAWNLAGLKCAQVIASNHDDAAAWRRIPLFRVPGPTPIGIAASTASYRDGGPWLDDLIALLAANHRRLADRVTADLPGVTLHPAEATFLAWLDCTGTGPDDPAAFFLERARVALTDGPPYGAGSERHVRMNVATSPALLDRMLDAMADAVRAR